MWGSEKEQKRKRKIHRELELEHFILQGERKGGRRRDEDRDEEEMVINDEHFRPFVPV